MAALDIVLVVVVIGVVDVEGRRMRLSNKAVDGSGDCREKGGIPNNIHVVDDGIDVEGNIVDVVDIVGFCIDVVDNDIVVVVDVVFIGVDVVVEVVVDSN